MAVLRASRVSSGDRRGAAAGVARRGAARPAPGRTPATRGSGQTAGAAYVAPAVEPPQAQTRQPCRMRIDGEWYDVSGWRAAHPGGAMWIDMFNGRDATGVFNALHSIGPNGAATAKERLQKLPRCDPPGPGEPGWGRLPDAASVAATASFQELRQALERDGFFERSVVQEAWSLAQVVGLFAAGTAVAWTQPLLATVLLGLGMQQAGWLAHDYIHGRGKWCDSMGWLGGVLNGHSGKWWAHKHSLHHCFTNEEEHDRDIMMEPFFYMREPAKSGRPDSPSRKWQHVYGYPLLSIMYWLWRFHSIADVIERRDWKEGALLAVNYAWLAMLPWQVAVGSVFFGGFLVGALVSATHQSEEIMTDGDEPDFVIGQLRSTRDADTVFGPVETWLWGGMDTQLEHHLFPTMPRYRYHKLRPILKEWALARGLDYRISPSTTIIKDNFATLKRVASA